MQCSKCLQFGTVWKGHQSDTICLDCRPCYLKAIQQLKRPDVAIPITLIAAAAISSYYHRHIIKRTIIACLISDEERAKEFLRAFFCKN